MKKKKEISNQLIEKMMVNGVDKIELDDCCIKLKSMVRPNTLKKENVKDSINKCIGNINKSDEITEYIFNNKGFAKVNDLKKVKK